MKRLISICTFFTLFIFSTPILSLAVSLENTGTVFQSNHCLECVDLEQANLLVITQNIQLDSHWVIPDNSFLIIEALKNIAIVDQNNFCEECNNVAQVNSTAVIQNIDLPQTSTANRSLADRGLDQGGITNIADVIQNNTCENCQFGGQIRSEEITQNMTFSNPFMLNSTQNPVGFSLSILSNFATVSQFNSCENCDRVSQGNLALIVQNISAVPEPKTIVLLGSGLLGLGLHHFFRSKKRIRFI